MQLLRSKTGFELCAELSFKIRGAMVSKRDWMKALEEEQSAKLILHNQAEEISASHQKILGTEIPPLWERIKQEIYDVLRTTELQGLRFNVHPIGVDSLRIVIIRVPSLLPAQAVDVSFVPLKYKLEVVDTDGHCTLSELFFHIVSGRLVLSDGSRPIKDEGRDLAEVACQRLLEPLLRPYI